MPSKKTTESVMGRKKVKIDEEQLKALMRLKPTMNDCAAFFGVSPDTIERRIRSLCNVTFAEFREQNMVHTRFSLIRKAIQKALNGDNTMLIFCLKNLCGWVDKIEQQGDVQLNIKHITPKSQREAVNEVANEVISEVVDV